MKANWVLDTQIDRIMSVVKRFGTISINKLVCYTGLRKRDLEPLLVILENRGLVGLKYGIFNSIEVKKVHVDIEVEKGTIIL